MLLREFGKTGWKLSTIGLGTWNIGNQWGEVDEASSYATIQAAFESGVNIFDSAESYGIPNGLSEQRLGRALTGIRHRAYVVSKIGNWGKRTGQGVPKTTTDMIRLCAHACLYRLRTDWMDVVLCHEWDIKEPDIYLEAFELLKKSGEIREYGISTDDLEVLKRFNVNGTCRVVEIDYSILNRKAESEMLPYCEEHGIAVLIRGPLAQGLLSGSYTHDSVFSDSVRTEWNAGGKRREDFEKKLTVVEKLKAFCEPGEEMIKTALRFSVSHKVAPVAIPGAKSAKQAQINAEAGQKLLTPAEIEHIKSL